MVALSKEQAKEKIANLVTEFESKKDYYWETDEANVETKLIEPLFDALGWTKKDFEKREKLTSKTGRRQIPDYTFKLNERPVFFLEAKKVSVDIETDQNTWRQAISYALSKRVPFAVLTNFRSIRIFCVEQENAAKNVFRYLKYNELKDRFADLWLLSKESFEKDEILHTAESEQRLKKRITLDDKLLEDFITSRRKIVASLEKNYPTKYNTEEKEDIAQRLLGRLIFIRKAEDIGINVDNEGKDIALLEEITELPDNEAFPKLKKIFQKYEEVFDSELFMQMYDKDLAHAEIEGKIVKELVKHLYYSRNGELVYNFDWITSDVLGNVYEQYLGTIVKETAKGAKAEESHPHRKEQGIYYTPTYVVDYIVRNTLGELIKNKKPLEVDKIKVLDPACGSGSFLIKAFDVLNEYYAKNDKNYSQTQLDATGEGATYSRKVRILENNIFGVDLDKKAVEISQLNLLLKIAEKKHRLPLLKDNIKVGNSLIDDPAVAEDKAFKWEEQFKEIMKDGFDVVVGNPPYVDIKQLDPKIVRHLFSKYVTVENRMNLYSTFVEKALYLLKEGGYFGFIIPNSILYNDSYKKIRELLLNSTNLRKIVRLPDNVFENVKVETIILIYQKGVKERGRKEKCEVLIYPREAAITSIHKENCQLSYFDQNDWKTQKIINISTDVSTKKLLNKIEDETTPLIKLCDFSLGLTPYDKYKGHTKKQIEDRVFHSNTRKDETFKPLLSGENIIRYGIFWDGKEYISYGNWLGAPREQRFFVKPRLVVRQIVSGKPPRIYAGYSEDELYNTQIGFNIIIKDETLVLTKYILAILDSKLMSFYHKEKYLDPSKNLFQKILIINAKKLPIKITSMDKQKEISNLVDRMLSRNKRLNEIGDKRTDEWVKVNEEIKKTDEKIDELVYKLYGITEEEKKIIKDSLK